MFMEKKKTTDGEQNLCFTASQLCVIIDIYAHGHLTLMPYSATSAHREL